MRCLFAQKSQLQQELDNIKVSLHDIGYPESITDGVISNKLARFQNLALSNVLYYIKLPWIGNTFLKFENKIKSFFVFKFKNCCQI